MSVQSSSMVGSWRYKIRSAQEAFDDGRLEEASRCIREDHLQQFLPGKQLAEKLAKQFCRRAHQYVIQKDLPCAWHDLMEARLIGGPQVEILKAQGELLETTLQQAKQLLSQQQLERALEILDLFQQHHMNDHRSEQLIQIAQQLKSAEQLSYQGRFGEASKAVGAARKLQPDLPRLDQLQSRYDQQRKQCRDLTDQLRRAMTHSNWSAAIAVSDQLLEMAPEYQVAKDARQICCWSELNASSTRRVQQRASKTSSPKSQSPLADTHSQTTQAQQAPTMVCQPSTTRFLLWVDAVGGFLVCLNDDVLIGQAVPDSQIDIPILGDISRRHVKLCRGGEGYFLEPLADVLVDGQRVAGRTLLADGDVIELGQGVVLRYSKPHSLSMTARLDFVSRHRTQPWADSVLLMAESCVLGPSSRNHITCHDWKDDVVLFRRDEKLFCRQSEPFEIDGNRCEGQGEVTLQSRVTGEDYSFSLEPI